MTHRRTFLKAAAALAASAAFAQKRGALKISLNAYSFAKLLNDAIRGRGEGTTLPKLIDWAAKGRFEGFDATGYYFPGYPELPPDSYVDSLRKKAADLGIGISGTGVRNNFTTSDQAVRAEGVKHIKEWCGVAARLGAPVIRVFADTQMRAESWETVAKGYTRAQVQDWIAAALRECADEAGKYKVKIGVQNHGDFLRTGEDLLALVQAVGSPWCGPIVDTGYFKSADPYADMALVAPRALNWQIKQSAFGQESDVPTDLVKLVTIIRKSGYSGYLPIETLAPRGKPYDPYTVVPAFANQLREAIEKTA